MTALHGYQVYGHCLASSMEFPDLPAMPPESPRWTFRTVTALAPLEDATEIGSDRIYAECFARLYAGREGHRVVVDDTGTFALSADRREVTWEEKREAWPDFVRAHLVGRVLATAMFLDGLLPLHGSAVATGAGTIAFLAPKRFGKSTLALALSSAGAPVVTDDTLPVAPGDPPLAWPGVEGLRVRDDSIDAVGVARPDLETREGKRIVVPSHSTALRRPAPLAALYLLDPALPEHGQATRTPLGPMLAAIGLVAHVKIGQMLGPSAAGAILERAAAIAKHAPVFRLHVPRDLAALPDAAQRLLEWHGGPAA